MCIWNYRRFIVENPDAWSLSQMLIAWRSIFKLAINMLSVRFVGPSNWRNALNCIKEHMKVLHGWKSNAASKGVNMHFQVNLTSISMLKLFIINLDHLVAEHLVASWSLLISMWETITSRLTSMCRVTFSKLMNGGACVLKVVGRGGKSPSIPWLGRELFLLTILQSLKMEPTTWDGYFPMKKISAGHEHLQVYVHKSYAC